MRRDGESQAQIHAGRITLDGCVNERRHAGEVYDAIQLLTDFTPLHSQKRTVQINIFTSRQVWVKAGSHLDQRGQAPIDSNATFSRSCDVVEEFQKSALACAILADDAERFSSIDLETHIAQRPEIIPVSPQPAAHPT